MSTEKIILDLCGGSGSWSLPYKRDGYDVRVITLPDLDVLDYVPPVKVHGVLAAPPCTVFSNAGAWIYRTDEEMIDALEVVLHCFRIIRQSQPEWWAMENPVGKLRRYLGGSYADLRPLRLWRPVDKENASMGLLPDSEKEPGTAALFLYRQMGRKER